MSDEYEETIDSLREQLDNEIYKDGDTISVSVSFLRTTVENYDWEIGVILSAERKQAQLAQLRADLAAAVEALKGARPLVEAMVGIGSSARFVLPEIDALLSRIEGGEK